MQTRKRAMSRRLMRAAIFIAGIAALFLATGVQAEPRPQLAFAAPADNVWHFDSYKKCTARVEFTLPPIAFKKDWIDEGMPTAEVIFDRTNLAKLEAAVRYLKKMSCVVLGSPQAKSSL